MRLERAANNPIFQVYTVVFSAFFRFRQVDFEADQPPPGNGLHALPAANHLAATARQSRASTKLGSPRPADPVQRQGLFGHHAGPV
jgi:hypothetical protein